MAVANPVQVGKQIIAEDCSRLALGRALCEVSAQDGSKTGQVEKGASYQGEWDSCSAKISSQMMPKPVITCADLTSCLGCM